MNLLTLDNITKTYTERKLLDGVNFYLQEGEKVGVIGINGTGKSTLLKIMAGLEEADTGTVTKANHVMIRFLSQGDRVGFLGENGCGKTTLMKVIAGRI